MSRTFLFQGIQFYYTVLIQTIQFIISVAFVYTQLIVKTVLYQIIQFSVSTVSISKTVLFQTIHFRIHKQLHFKQFTLAWIRSLNVKTVLFRAIQFIINALSIYLEELLWYYSTHSREDQGVHTESKRKSPTGVRTLTTMSQSSA